MSAVLCNETPHIVRQKIFGTFPIICEVIIIEFRSFCKNLNRNRIFTKLNKGMVNNILKV